MKTRLFLLFVLCALLAAGAAQAGASPNYRMDWAVPLTGLGGSSASSQYAIQDTIGQTSAGGAASAAYRVQVGYWQKFLGQFEMFLPLTRK